MKLTNVFPSNFLKASDLNGREHTLTIAKCLMEEVGDDNRLVIYFAGKEKGMVCNKTNANRIALYYGDDTDGWIGKQITIGCELVEYQGKTTEAIRVKAGGASTQQGAGAGVPFNDEVPF